MRPFTTVLLAFLTGSAAAQVDYPTCLSGFSWAFNSLNQSPCQVASALGEACTGLDFPIPNLTSTQNYLGPIPAAANQCRCSSVFYSVLSACAVCQDALVSTWSFYNENCTEVSVSVFPPPIPSGIAVPNYAYLDPTANGVNTFNPQIAQSDVGPDSTAVSQPTGVTSTSASGTTLPTSSKKKSSNAGAIAGGVVGGVVAVLIIVGLILFLRRRKPVKTTEPFDSDKLVAETTPGNISSTIPSTPAPAKYYDPNDPTTYPAEPFVPSLYSSPSPPSQNQSFPHSVVGANHTGTTNYSGMGVIPQQNISYHPGQAGYTGTAEVM
ncbi:hypothetical protein HYPSUDRAFT_33907 [Hypholoma sublateritium FD-334 SS-4]|uniref:Uncharacterized protein n=1 Tax=Hypholoma sublateritium (strain FD-334 SS-4) TaxID=945553 RepID=A0A0D2MWT8_HYPSF|nr:hypothetical protein HYPSUDRAFT_33907 [Hypholoma sublateritium FD-334 SS-4]